MSAREPVIGILLKGYPRLSETFIVREITLLEALGLKLHVFALRDPGEQIAQEDVRRVRAPVTYVPDDFSQSFGVVARANLRLWRRRPAVYGSALRHALVRSLRMRSSAILKRFLQAAYLVEHSLLGSDIAHLHAHFAHDPTTVAFYAARLAGIRYSFSAHAKDVFTEDAAWLSEKLAGATFAVTCTEHNRAYLEERAAGTVRVLRSYHGLRLEDFTPARRDRTAPTRIISVGRLVPKKGFLVLIRALAMMRNLGVPFHATIVGSGPQKDELLGEIRKLGLEGVVELRAPMAQRELLEHVRDSDAFVMACQVEEDGDRDGIPNVIVEAMALELPVVATRVSGIPELIEDGVNGILVPERNAAALAAALRDLIEDPERARRIGRAARVRVESGFEARTNVKIIREALCQALAALAPEERHVVVR